MKGNKLTYKTIEEIVDGVCLDLQEGAQRKEQYLHWAIKEAERWKSDISREVKTVKLDLTPWKAIELPSDCIRWTKIGVQDGDVIKVFVNKRDIAIHHELNGNGIKILNPEPTSIPKVVPTSDNAIYPFFNYSANGEHPGKLFGYSAKENGFGYFTEAGENSNEIQFRTEIPAGTKIYLEYISDGWNPNSQTLIHPLGAELIALGVHYRRLKHNPTVPRTLVAEAKRDYIEEYDRVIDRIWDYTPEDIIETTNEGYLGTANPVY